MHLFLWQFFCKLKLIGVQQWFYLQFWHKPWQISIFVTLACLLCDTYNIWDIVYIYYMHSTYIFLLKWFCGSLKVRVEKISMIRNHRYLRDRYHWGVALLISQAIAPRTSHNFVSSGCSTIIFQKWNKKRARFAAVFNIWLNYPRSLITLYWLSTVLWNFVDI